MKIFLTSVTSMMFLMLAVKQFLSNRRVIHPDEDKAVLVPYMAVAIVFNLLCSAFCDHTMLTGLPFCVLLGVTVMYLMSISFIPFDGRIKIVVLAAMMTEILMGIYSLLCILGVLTYLSSMFYGICSIIIAGLIFVIYVKGLYDRLRDVKSVMRSGSVWTNVTLSVDSIYLAVILILTMMYVVMAFYSRDDDVWYIFVFTMLFSSLYAALSVRFLHSSAFVFMTDQERKIVESMRISHADASVDGSGTAVLYKNIYDRVLEHFTEAKPYLNPNLTINDVVEVVFSNKLYISKAINQFTGRNFCQFVNYYRVVHAIELFRSNTELKVLELANLSGFNSPVSFGMAFKLYMGEKPGDWCRREKFRLDKLKK